MSRRPTDPSFPHGVPLPNVRPRSRARLRGFLIGGVCGAIFLFVVGISSRSQSASGTGYVIGEIVGSVLVAVVGFAIFGLIGLGIGTLVYLHKKRRNQQLVAELRNLSPSQQPTEQSET